MQRGGTRIPAGAALKILGLDKKGANLIAVVAIGGAIHITHQQTQLVERPVCKADDKGAVGGGPYISTISLRCDGRGSIGGKSASCGSAGGSLLFISWVDRQPLKPSSDNNETSNQFCSLRKRIFIMQKGVK